jgi:predicted nucleic acid-binding protein
MRYVLDSSVALKWLLPEVDSDKAIRLRANFQNGVHELLAPDIFPLEILNSLSKAERTRRIAVGNGYSLWQSLLTDVPAFYPHAPLLDRAYQIASPARVAIYDCLYVALAERERCEIVTADDRLGKNLQGAYPFVRALSSF